MRIIKLIVILITPLAFMACLTPKKASKSKDKAEIQEIQIVESGEINTSTDPYTVQSLSIQDNILEIEVCYGGCAEHDGVRAGAERGCSTSRRRIDFGSRNSSGVVPGSDDERVGDIAGEVGRGQEPYPRSPMAG